MPHARRIGVILAAGRGRRMGRTKQLVEWESAAGTKPLVAAAYDAIASVCNDMVVVVGHDAELVVTALGSRTFFQARGNADAPMFESIRSGLRAARSIDTTASVVLQPGDHPEVAATTLVTLVDWALKQPEQAIIPKYRGRGGHPVIIPAGIAEMLVAAECPTGLAEFWLANSELCVRVPVADLMVIRDVDTSADLQH